MHEHSEAMSTRFGAYHEIVHAVHDFRIAHHAPLFAVAVCGSTFGLTDVEYAGNLVTCLRCTAVMLTDQWSTANQRPEEYDEH